MSEAMDGRSIVVVMRILPKVVGTKNVSSTLLRVCASIVGRSGTTREKGRARGNER
jgi:hypothetical protein